MNSQNKGTPLTLDQKHVGCEGYSCNPERPWFVRAEGRRPWRCWVRARPLETTNLLQEQQRCSSLGARTDHTAWRALRDGANIKHHHGTSAWPLNTPLELISNTNLWSSLGGFSAPCTWWRIRRAGRRRRQDSAWRCPESAVAPQQLQHAVKHRGTSEEPKEKIRKGEGGKFTEKKRSCTVYCSVSNRFIYCISRTNRNWQSLLTMIKIELNDKLTICNLLSIVPANKKNIQEDYNNNLSTFFSSLFNLYMKWNAE